MSSETDSPTPGRDAVAVVRDAVGVRGLAMLVAGVLAGASLSLLGEGTVAVPVIGTVPGAVLGAVGLVTAVGVYRRGGCCGDCGEKDCGCTGSCDDSCSHEP